MWCSLFWNFLVQVMYAFVMRPESLPKAYQDFIQKTGPVAAPVYRAVRESCRGSLIDFDSLSIYLSKKKALSQIKLDELSSIIPCSIIHPNTNSCSMHIGKATLSTFRKTFPLYFSLTFVPFVVLHLQKVWGVFHMLHAIYQSAQYYTFHVHDQTFIIGHCIMDCVYYQNNTFLHLP